MKNSWKINLALASCALALCAPVSAADTLLAATELELADGKVTAELWGDRYTSGYADDLLVLLKDGKQKIMTAYAPSVKGGYNPLLQAVQIKPLTNAESADAEENSSAAKKDQQLLLSVAQGDWRTISEYRVLDFADLKKVQEIFGAVESMGLVSDAYNKEEKLYVTLKDGQKNITDMPAETGLGRINFGGTYSVTAYDLDGDGQQELLCTQQVLQGKDHLADVGVLWQLQPDNSWKNSNITLMTATPTLKSNTVNDGREIAKGVILPRKIVMPGGEATYPIFVAQDIQLQNKLNRFLAEENKEYLAAFYEGTADMAFKVITADEKLVSIQLISGKTNFLHHHINFNPQTGEKISLEQILNTKDSDLMPLLRLLNNNHNIILEQKLPAEWYIEGNNLFLMQRICGKDEVAGFALGNLHKFLLDKKWLPKNTD